MRVNPVSEGAYLQARMTLDAMRQEVLLHRQISEQFQKAVQDLEAKVKELEPEIAELKKEIARLVLIVQEPQSTEEEES